MKRRDMLSLIPAVGAGLLAAGRERRALAGEGRPLGLDYLDRVVGFFGKIRATGTDDMLEAAYHIAAARTRGGTCFCQWETGHSFDGDMFPGRPGDPDIFVMGYTMGQPPVDPKRGDLLIVNVLRQPLEDPREKGIFVIGGPTPWCADTANTELLTERNRRLEIRKHSDIWIETYNPTLGALMWLPGADAPLGPTSGALGMVSYWSMIADAVRILARGGVAVGMKGDEPPLGGDAPYESLDRPLGAAYIDAAVRQVRMIEAEYGVVKRIASAAADRILDGGSLYVYSRYRQALSAEARGKRGGLALIKTTWAGDASFEPGGRDLVIMGIYRPDDETDLAMLDRCRNAGTAVAAIGPATRDARAPEGRTVRGRADLHLGLMCDTYGLFALPGVERKVCPTSGLLVNLMFWTTMIELAEEIMRRTGDTPAVLSTGALIGGGEQRRRSTELAKSRGY